MVLEEGVKNPRQLMVFTNRRGRLEIRAQVVLSILPLTISL